MRAFLFLIAVLFITSCKSEGKSHRYLNDRKNPSEEISDDHHKGSKRADKVFHKNLKKNKKKGQKKNGKFFKK